MKNSHRLPILLLLLQSCLACASNTTPEKAALPVECLGALSPNESPHLGVMRDCWNDLQVYKASGKPQFEIAPLQEVLNRFQAEDHCLSLYIDYFGHKSCDFESGRNSLTDDDAAWFDFVCDGEAIGSSCYMEDF